MKTEHREHPLGTPGASARRMAAAPRPPQAWLRFLGGLFPGLGRPVTSWEKGAEGEERVAKRLAKLSPEGWISLHDLPLGDGGRNVDHLVIGTGGVFSVNTKNVSRTVVVKENAFLVGGFPDRSLHVARDEAHRVGKRLTVALGTPVVVEPVLVVLSPSLEVRARQEDVHVLGERDVPSWFERRTQVLEPAAASRIYRCARRSSIWTAS